MGTIILAKCGLEKYTILISSTPTLKATGRKRCAYSFKSLLIMLFFYIKLMYSLSINYMQFREFFDNLANVDGIWDLAGYERMC